MTAVLTILLIRFWEICFRLIAAAAARIAIGRDAYTPEVPICNAQDVTYYLENG